MEDCPIDSEKREIIDVDKGIKFDLAVVGRYLVEIRLKKSCFLCGTARNCGHRYYSIGDLVVIGCLIFQGKITADIFCGISSLARDCLYLFGSTDFNLSDLKDAVQQMVIANTTTEKDQIRTQLEANKLFEKRRKGVQGGIPTCWRSCESSSRFHTVLHAISCTSLSVAEGKGFSEFEVDLCRQLNFSPHGGPVICDGPFQLGGYMRYDPALYETLLKNKVSATKEYFSPIFCLSKASISPDHVEVFRSPAKFYRQRCRFAFQRCDSYHLSDDGHWSSSSAVVAETAKNQSEINFLMWEEDGSIGPPVEIFPIASKLINAAIPKVRMELSTCIRLTNDLQSVHFLSTLAGHLMIRLVYNQRMGEEEKWSDAASNMKSALLSSSLKVAGLTSLSIVCKAPQTKIVVGSDTVEERFKLADGRVISYLQSIDGFSNPNAAVNIKCLNWLCEIVASISWRISAKGDKLVGRRVESWEGLRAASDENDSTDERGKYFDCESKLLDKRPPLSDDNYVTNMNSNKDHIHSFVNNFEGANVSGKDERPSNFAEVRQSLDEKYDSPSDSGAIASRAIYTVNGSVHETHVNPMKPDEAGLVGARRLNSEYGVQINGGPTSEGDQGDVLENCYEEEAVLEGTNGCGGKSSRCDHDLLELYCGMGNHTMALAKYARFVVAVELNKSLCAAAVENARRNGINNVKVIACDSEKFAKSILKRKMFIDRTGGGERVTLQGTGDSTIGEGAPNESGGKTDKEKCDQPAEITITTTTAYNFSTVLVDPPRSGLDSTTRRLVCNYDNIIYISCNQEALHRDLQTICRSHRIERFAVFDHFAYTNHVECGVYLSKIS